MATLFELLSSIGQPSRDEQFKSLMGSAPAPQAGAFQPDQQPQMMGGSGFLGSDRGAQAQGNLMSGLMDMYTPQESQGLFGVLSPKQEKPTTFMQNFASFQDAPQSVKDLMLDYKRSGAQNINMGGAGGMWTPEQVEKANLQPGTVVTTDRYGKPQILKSEKFTQPQILSGGFANRMDTAEGNLQSVMETGFDPSGIMQNIDMFGMPDVLANYVRTPEGQKYRQAQVNWVTANLRKESGAAIPEEETEREITKWFPQPGDSAATIQQKMVSRQDANRAMQKSAGGAYGELKEEKEAAPKPIPSGVSEDDIEETMKANSMTRKEVIDRLNKR